MYVAFNLLYTIWSYAFRIIIGVISDIKVCLDFGLKSYTENLKM